MNKNQLKALVKEVVGIINEFIGDKPAMGQKYFKVTVTDEYIGPLYKGTPRTSVWPKVLAKDEADAKKNVLSSFNMRVVKIHDIKAELIADVSQSDIEKYDKDTSYYANVLRPKSAGGLGSN